MKSFLVYSVLGVGMVASAMLAIVGFGAFFTGGDTLGLAALFTLNTFLMGSCAREYAKS